jgi:hypothetical protein
MLLEGRERRGAIVFDSFQQIEFQSLNDMPFPSLPVTVKVQVEHILYYSKLPVGYLGVWPIKCSHEQIKLLGLEEIDI